MRDKPVRKPKPKPEFSVALSDPFAEKNRRIIARMPDNEHRPLNIIEQESEETD